MRAIGITGPPRVLSIAQLTDSIGLGGYLVCSALYFTRSVGLTPTQGGFGLTVGGAGGCLACVPLGPLADRRGPRGVAMLLAVTTALALVLFLFVRSFVPFVVVASLYCAAQCGLTAARQGLLAGLVPTSERTRVRAVLQTAINGGIAVGAAAGGLALQLDTEAAYLTVFAVDAVSLLVSASVLLRLPTVAPEPRRLPGEPALAVLRDRPYAVIAVLNMVLQLHIPLITLGIPLWIVQRTHAPGWTVAALLVLNTMSVVAFQVRGARQVRAAGAVLLVACVVFALSAAGDSPVVAVAVLLLAAALQALAEMMQA